MRLRLKIDSMAINWSGPAETPPERCSVCEAPFTEDDVPTSVWSSEGWAASFCDDCVEKCIELEKTP
jgi:hypothetical protein